MLQFELNAHRFEFSCGRMVDEVKREFGHAVSSHVAKVLQNDFEGIGFDRGCGGEKYKNTKKQAAPGMTQPQPKQKAFIYPQITQIYTDVNQSEDSYL